MPSNELPVLKEFIQWAEEVLSHPRSEPEAGQRERPCVNGCGGCKAKTTTEAPPQEQPFGILK